MSDPIVRKRITPTLRAFTRRKFGLFLGGAGLASMSRIWTPPAMADTGPDFSIVVMPDTQYLSDNGRAPEMVDMMQWIVDQRSTYNIKAVVGVGDCANAASFSTPSVSNNDYVVNMAYERLWSAGIPGVSPPGNHDYVSSSASRRGGANGIGWNFSTGFFAHPALSSRFGSGGTTITGSNDRAFYVGCFDEANAAGTVANGSTGAANTTAGAVDTSIAPANSGANTAYKFHIGPYRLLLFCLEFHPRTSVLNWAKSLHDASPDYDCFISTHSYSNVSKALTVRGDGGFGPDYYTQPLAPEATDGQEMFYGSTDASWTSSNSFQTWGNLQAIFCGHDLRGNGGLLRYFYAQNDARLKTNGRYITEVFADYQERDNEASGNNAEYLNGTLGSVGSGAGPSRTMAHVVIMQFKPSLGQLEFLVYNHGTRKWCSTTDNDWASSTPTVLTTLSGFQFISGSTAPSLGKS